MKWSEGLKKRELLNGEKRENKRREVGYGNMEVREKCE